ncbi:hypothetical protein GCM10008995_07030 [Halobellus salinus]|uniref:Uncharacterized protein n=1 Tax=Halobellus salinus TaxID=931585 RepID=A0A830EMY7_9EURY|nr:hypothetical protein [Halobellus salinus]GGI99771.1 hypothetical protein GCM10008995_07030 [Halobellus salinus]SMP02524.1 hypothetical protein SAMN06265347_101206 [Halobellus salinus]
MNRRTLLATVGNAAGSAALGVGQFSECQFNNVFTVENQGTQDVFVSLAPTTGIPIDSGADGDDIDVKFFVTDNGNPTPVENGQGPGPISGGSGSPQNVLELSTGEDQGIGMFMTTFGHSSVDSNSVNSGSQTTTPEADEEQPSGSNAIDSNSPGIGP